MRNIFIIFSKAETFSATLKPKSFPDFQRKFRFCIIPLFWGDPMTHRVGWIFSGIFLWIHHTPPCLHARFASAIPKPPEVTDIAEAINSFWIAFLAPDKFLGFFLN